jgi:hypothetical protein
VQISEAVAVIAGTCCECAVDRVTSPRSRDTHTYRVTWHVANINVVSRVKLLVGWLGGWSVGWLVGWVVGWLAGWVGGRLVGWLGGS